MANWERTLLIIALVLVIIGGLNWGVVGLFSTNIVSSLNRATFKSSFLERGLYILIGIAAIYLIFKFGSLLCDNVSI